MPLNKKAGALFDVKPVDESGSVDLNKTEHISPVVNLSSYRFKKAVLKRSDFNISQKVKPAPISKPKIIASGGGVKNEFENFLNNELDLDIELAKIGAPQTSLNTKPRYRVIQSRKSAALPLTSEIPAPSALETEPAPEVIEPPVPGLDLNAVVSEIEHSARALPENSASLPLDEFSSKSESVHDFMTAPTLRSLGESVVAKPVAAVQPRRSQNFKLPKAKRSLRFPRLGRKRLGVIVIVFLGVGTLAWSGLRLKQSVVADSSQAVTNLQSAHNDLAMLQFSSASEDFAQAYQNFSKASDNLNFMGSIITSVIGSLPGGGSVKSANNLVQVGKLLSNAGSAMTDALNAVAKAGILLNPTGNQVAIGNVVGALNEALNISKGDVIKAKSLLANVDSSIIPANQQASFNDFKDKLPLLEQTITQSSDYANFFDQILSGGSHKYLILFENSSELRPTGGFPGTYAVVSFSDGKMDNFFVDDIYNIDGQLKQNIVPPLQLQHITPTWGMRDSNWYVDYPTSARNIEDFYKKESGQSVDGVIVVNPQLAADILKIVGPVEMPNYNLTLTSDNLLTTIQDQVEYGPNRTQPKQIVKDFAPLLLKKIYSANSDQWLAIFNSIVQSIDQQRILMFFNDLNSESFATDHGFGGQVKQVSGDYLMPVVVNVKGSKTDAVTDTSFDLTTSFQNQDAVHTLTITRTHNGGNEKFGFYNVQNPAYVRVLVPDGAEFVSISGNDNPHFGPLVDYSKGFTRDDQLTQFETSGQTDSSDGVTTYRESGKTEFGFWLITNPGKTKSVQLTYKVPNALANDSYQLYVQKQPGLVVKDFSFDLHPQNNLTPVASTPLLKQSGDSYDYAAPLTGDLELQVNFQ